MEKVTPKVLGIDVDAQTRCAHWHSPIDVIAIRMKCCGEFFACKDCHDAIANHPAATWPESEWDTKAVLCGVCSHQMSIHEYMNCQNQCPACHAHFNPRCNLHYPLYFQMA